MRSIIRRLWPELPGFDPANAQFIDNPYPTFDHLRKKEPIHQIRSGAWILLQYEDVSNALTDPRFGNAPSPYATVHPRNRERYICADVANNILPFLDSPEHDIPRRLIVQAYRNSMKDAAPDIAEMAESLLAENMQNSKMEIVGDFATPLSFGVMCHLFNLPQKDIPLLVNWCHYFFYLFMAIPSQEIFDEVEIALAEFRAYLKNKLTERRQTQGNGDILTALLEAEIGGKTLSEEQIIDNAMLLFADGIENVDKGIGNALYCLLKHPDQWRLLQQHAEIIPQAVEECLRFEAPAQYIGRIAREDIPLRGQVIKKDLPVLLVLGSANRDPGVFKNPNKFNIQRNPNKHLSFGRAKHSCIGGGLVKSEMVAALNALARCGKDLRLITTQPNWLARPGHRWVKSLEVEFLSS